MVNETTVQKLIEMRLTAMAESLEASLLIPILAHYLLKKDLGLL